ncbi:MAG: stalk domain-containing protein [Monoglobaceae bacterium]
MIRKRMTAMLMAVFMLLPLNVSASKEKVGVGYAEYNLEDSLLFGLTEDDIFCSAGHFDNSYNVGSSQECLVDGTFSLMTGTLTRWVVADGKQRGAYLIANLGSYKTFDKFIMATGLDKGIYRESNFRLHDFSIYYWDDYKWVEIPIPLEADTNSSVMRIDFEPVTSCKFKLVSNQSDAFRVQEIALMEPGVEPNYGTHKINQKTADNYDRITILGCNYMHEETIPERTYKKEDNKVVYREDMWTTFVSSKEVENIFPVQTVHNNENDSVEFTYEDKKISFTAGRKSYIKNGEDTAMDVAPYTDGTAIFIPIRDLVHSFDYYMSWNNKTAEIKLYDPRDMLLPNARNLDYMNEKGVRSPYKVEVNGKEQIVWGACNNDFVQHECADKNEDNIEVKVTYDKPIETAEILPTSRGLKGTIDGNTFTFTAKCNDYLDIEINGDYNRPLFVFLLEPIEKPDASDENTIILDKDDVYEFQNLQLLDNMTVYIGPNVVLLTNIWIHGAKNVKIIGNGIILSPINGVCVQTYMSDGIHIEGPMLPQYKSWKFQMGGCKNITIKNVRECSTEIGADGMDPTGCSNLVVDHMFTKLRDDAVALKSGVKAEYQRPGIDMYADNTNIEIKNCTYICMATGNPIEIGFELNGGGKVSGMKVSNIDVIRKGTDERAKNWRGALTIHHSGNAKIENVTYEDVRVERADEGFLCVGYFYVPVYYFDDIKPPKGVEIKNITYKNMEYNGEANAPSYFYNIMRDSTGNRAGWGTYLDITNPDYTIKLENIVLDNVTYQGRHIDSLETAKECNFYIDPGVDIKFK